MAEQAFTFAKSTTLFATPVMTYAIADADRLNAALLAEIADRRAAEPGVVRSNRAGWHSASDFFERREPAHLEVARAIKSACRDGTDRLRQRGGGKAPYFMQINGWINVNPPGAYNVPHDHPGSFWSGCYYIKTSEARHAGDEAGAITFLDPRCAPAGQPIIRAPIFGGSHSLQPEPGTLLLFPSNVKHWVHPNESTEDRVTMAFNVFMFARRASDRRPPEPAEAS